MRGSDLARRTARLRLGVFAVSILSALLLAAGPSLANKIKLHVEVLDAIPASTAYSWSTFTSYSAPISSSISQVVQLTGYEIKLGLPDGRIAIAVCEKEA